MTTKEILVGALERVKRGWTQDEYARDESGAHVDQYAKDATCWCIAGAISAAKGEGGYWPSDTIRYFMDINGISDVADWNDAPGRTQAEVIAAFTRAIAKCDEEGQ